MTDGRLSAPSPLSRRHETHPVPAGAPVPVTSPRGPGQDEAGPGGRRPRGDARRTRLVAACDLAVPAFLAGCKRLAVPTAVEPRPPTGPSSGQSRPRGSGSPAGSGTPPVSRSGPPGSVPPRQRPRYSPGTRPASTSAWVTRTPGRMTGSAPTRARRPSTACQTRRSGGFAALRSHPAGGDRPPGLAARGVRGRRIRPGDCARERHGCTTFYSTRHFPDTWRSVPTATLKRRSVWR